MNSLESESTSLEPPEPETWWNRPCGGKALLAVSLPMVVSTMSFVVMQFCDRLFLTWYSSHDLAAVVPSGVLAWTCFSFPLGIAMYVTTFVAQYDGAKQFSKIGPIVWQGVWIGIVLFPVFLIAGYYSSYFFGMIGHSEELVWREAKYFNALCYSSAATVMAAALEGFFIGRGKTTTIMLVSISAASLNILLDYYMIFGLQINGWTLLQAGGIGGAGLATSIATWFKTLVLMAIFLKAGHRRQFGTLSGWRLSTRPILRLFKFGIPNGLQFLLEGGAITVFILIIARISDFASAAAALAFSINMIVFVPIFGLGIGVTTLVGQQIGEKRPDLAARATWTSLWFGLPYTASFGLAYFLVPDWFLAAHNVGTEEYARVEALAVYLLRFVAVYCVFDSIQILFVSCIKGAGDTRFVVLVTLISSFLFLLAGFGGAYFFQSSQEWELNWWWGCLTSWIFVLSVTYFLRFRQGKWRQMTVIEPELVKPEVLAPSA